MTTLLQFYHKKRFERILQQSISSDNKESQVEEEIINAGIINNSESTSHDS